MRTLAKALLATGLFAISCQAGAVIIGHKDWRQLTETVDFTWDEINSVCGSGLSSGGTGALSTLNGWRWADYDQMSDLLLGLMDAPWTDCIPGTFDCVYVGQSPGIVWAMTRFAPTLADSTWNVIGVYGWTRTPFFQALLADDPAGEVAAIVDWQSGDDRLDFVGAWLYRPAPEPGTLALLGLSRRRKH